MSSLRSEFHSFYENLTLHIVPGPRSLSYFFPFVLVPVALLIPPSVLSHRALRWVFLPIIYSIQLHVWAIHQSFDVISMNHALMTFMLIGWFDVRKDFKYVQRTSSTLGEIKKGDDSAVSPPQEARASTEVARTHNARDKCSQRAFLLEGYPSSMLARLRWVGALMGSLRLTDWHIGIPSHDARQPSSVQPFSNFFMNTLAHAIFSYVLLDWTSASVHRHTPPLHTHINTETLTNVVVGSLTLLGHLYAALSLLTFLLPTLIALIFIAPLPHLQEHSMVSPLTWPSHFGAVSSIFLASPERPSSFGLRAFWGTFWHQNMRLYTSTPGIALSTYLKLPRGSYSRYMLTVAASFFWSGVVHMGVVPPQPLDTTWSAWQLRLSLATFFWIQFPGIALEVVLQSLLRESFTHMVLKDAKQDQSDTSHKYSNSVSSQHRLIALLTSCVIGVWTFGYLAFTAWLFVEPVGRELQWWKLPLVPWSILAFFNVRS